MIVEKMSAIVPMSMVDDIVENAYGDSPMLRSLREHYAARRAAEEAAWRALPWYVRLHRTAYFWSWRAPQAAKEWLHRTLFPECDQ